MPKSKDFVDILKDTKKKFVKGMDYLDFKGKKLEDYLKQKKKKLLPKPGKARK